MLPKYLYILAGFIGLQSVYEHHVLRKVPSVLCLHLGILKPTMEIAKDGTTRTSSIKKDLRRVSIPATITVPFINAGGERCEQLLHLNAVNYHKGNPVYGPMDAEHGHATQTCLVGGNFFHFDDNKTPVEVSFEQAVTPGPKQNILMVKQHWLLVWLRCSILYFLFHLLFFYLLCRRYTQLLITAKTHVQERSTRRSHISCKWY
jgi:hypothetical protein